MTTDKSFEIEYAHQVKPDTVYYCFEFRTARVVLYRHRCRYGAEPDDFTCHDAATDEWLGYGETKDEAVGQAVYTLMDRSRKAFEAQHAS